MITCWLGQAVWAQGWTNWLDELIVRFTRLWRPDSFFNLEFNVKSLLAILLAGLICGAVGSLVVGNRMAFFSDALAHCAFAGVALGFLTALLAQVGKDQFWTWVTPIMVAFGILVGLGIAFVRDRTGLASDTVIGVFFAGAIGFAAVLKEVIRNRRLFTMEDFLFGNPLVATSLDLIVLFALAVVTLVVLAWMYNQLVFASFNASLARSRRIPVRLCSYLFIVLLAVIVNLCLKTVGVLLINALLIVPAATAANLSRNMRQLFWGTIILCGVVTVLGQWLSWSVRLPDPNNPRNPIQFSVSGTMVVLSVILFYLSMVLASSRRSWPLRRQPLTVEARDR